MEDAVLAHDAFVGGLHFGGGDDNGPGDPVALDGDEFRLVLGVKEIVGVLESLHLGAVDLIHHRAGKPGDEGGEAVAFDPGEDHHVLAFLEDGVTHVVLEDLADAGARELVSGVEVEVEGLARPAASRCGEVYLDALRFEGPDACDGFPQRRWQRGRIVPGGFELGHGARVGLLQLVRDPHEAPQPPRLEEARHGHHATASLAHLEGHDATQLLGDLCSFDAEDGPPGAVDACVCPLSEGSRGRGRAATGCMDQ